MTAELILATAAVIGVCITGGSLVVSLRRNGRDQKARDEQIAKEQHERDKGIEMGYLAITERLDNPSHGLEALDTKITNIKTEYGVTLGRHDERLNALEQ